MKSAKKAKSPKKVKQPKLAGDKRAFKSKRQQKKEAQLREKKISKMLGTFTIILCLISSGLDLILKIKNDDKNK